MNDHDRLVRLDALYRESQRQLARDALELRRQLDEISHATDEAMSRAEVRLLIDPLAGRVDALGSTISQLNTVLATLRASLSGKDEGQSETQRQLDRNRALIFALAGLILTVIPLVFLLRR